MTDAFKTGPFAGDTAQDRKLARDRTRSLLNPHWSIEDIAAKAYIKGLHDHHQATEIDFARSQDSLIRHAYRPHKKYPWFCADCGYPEHEMLKHLPAPEGE